MTPFPLPAALADDLRRVERIVLDRTSSRSTVISAAGPTVDARRMRAALVLISALTGNYRAELLLHAAAAVELIYAATRAHGALVDEGARRRGANGPGEWSQGLPLMVGDYLFALAAGEMALTPDPRVIDYYAQAVQQFTEATLAPPPPLRPLEPARGRHIERLAGAAGLVAAACKAGGACAGVGPDEIELLARYGHSLGLAIALAEEIAALQPGADPDPATVLQAGAVSLPLVWAAHLGDGERLARALDSGDPAELSWVLAEVTRYGLAPARAEVARQTAAAQSVLTALPPEQGREALAMAAEYPRTLAAWGEPQG